MFRLLPYLLLLLVPACAMLPSARESQARKNAEAILAPYLKAARSVRMPAAAPDDRRVKVFLPSYSTIYFPDPGLSFSAKPRPSEMNALKRFLMSRRAELGAPGDLSGFELQLKSHSVVSDRLYLQFQQVVRRKVGQDPYFIPIVGSTVVAEIKNGRLKTLSTSLAVPPSISGVFRNPGLELAFTPKEFAVFMGLLKGNPAARESMRAYMDAVARATKQNFSFDSFVNRDVAEQQATLTEFWRGLGATSTARLLIDAGRTNTLSYVRYGQTWMLQISSLFGLPVNFDLEIPRKDNERLVARNLRHTQNKLVVHAFTSPNFPGGKKTEGGEPAERVSNRFQQVARYYQDYFGWTSFGGKDSTNELIVHAGNRTVNFKENAAWVGSMQKFVVGEGGNTFSKLDDSLSVLGHEYAHAVLQFSSGLVYKGESGALNEHFADLQGASIDATLNRGGVYDFTIGTDVLAPPVRQEREKLLNLIFTEYKYTPAEKESFALDRVGLRHLYAPVLSFATQYDSMDSVRAAFTDRCEPSVDNDNCGVHSASGVPNKAASLIISVLGLEKTRALFFNTLVYRLTPSSTFKDYVIQLNDECEDTPELAGRCDVILASFAAVGVYHPQMPQTKDVGLESGEMEDGAESGQARVFPPAPIPATQLVSEVASTPFLRFAGWVDVGQDDVQIFDGKFNARVLKQNTEILTRGDYSALAKLTCARVTGRVTQLTLEDGKLSNVFTEIQKVEDRGGKCAVDPDIAGKKPDPRPVNTLRKDRFLDYCGWVSVNSRSKNVTIIDNRYDAAILHSGYKKLTKGDYRELHELECACVRGRIDQVRNSKKTLFNYFTEVKDIKPRTPEDCADLIWR